MVERFGKYYTVEQNNKLRQFGMACATVQFLHKRDSLLNQGYRFAMTPQGGDPTKPTVFDQEMYWMVQGAAGKLFNQLMDMGFKDEIRGIIEQKTHYKEIEEEQLPQIGEFRDIA